jgi:hypothetical protein
MKRNRAAFLSILTLVVLVAGSTTLRAQGSDGPCDSLSRQQFFLMTRHIKELMDKHATMSLSDDRKMVRLFSTMFTSADLFKDSLNKDSLLEHFSAEFWKVYFDRLKQKYDLVVTKGGTMYLSKLDLHIGMGPEYRCKDFYQVY